MDFSYADQIAIEDVFAIDTVVLITTHGRTTKLDGLKADFAAAGVPMPPSKEEARATWDLPDFKKKEPKETPAAKRARLAAEAKAKATAASSASSGGASPTAPSQGTAAPSHAAAPQERALSAALRRRLETANKDSTQGA